MTTTPMTAQEATAESSGSDTPPTGQPVRQVLEMDPSTLLVDKNLREADLDTAFLASIREHGVLVPVTAVRTAEGAIRVRLGHRRTLAAHECGRSVPVIIVGDEGSDKAATIERILHQYAENERRTGLSTAEQVGAAEQLSLLGVSPTQIAKRTQMSRPQVKAALSVAGSPLARGATERWDFLDLEQAAVIGEFEDRPDTVTELVKVIRAGGNWQHVAQRARDEQAAAQARTDAETHLRETGVNVITLDTFRADPKAERLTSLNDAEGDVLTSDTHTTCPGHAAYLTEDWIYEEPDGSDDATKTSSEDHDDDPDQDSGDPIDGQAEQDDEEEGNARLAWVATWVCLNPDEHGHVSRWSSATTTKVKAADLPTAEREAAATLRRETVTNNKAWESAQTVRRAWLQNFAARTPTGRAISKGSPAFVAAALAFDATLVADYKANQFAAELLGGKADDGHYYYRHTHIQKLLTGASEARAQHILLILVLAAYETHTTREHWRTHSPATARYLTHLSTLGYGLSDVEELARNESRPDTYPSHSDQDDSDPSNGDQGDTDPTGQEDDQASDEPGEGEPLSA